MLFPGWVNKPEIWILMRIAQVGLAPYRSTEDFIISIPNKAIEYMSAGLPVISSLKMIIRIACFLYCVIFTITLRNWRSCLKIHTHFLKNGLSQRKFIRTCVTI